MIFWWQTIRDKKAGAKRPRVITKIVMPSDVILSTAGVLEIIRVESGWMKMAMEQVQSTTG